MELPRRENSTFMPILAAAVQEGQKVPLLVSGDSMMPFLKHGRDTIIISKPSKPFRRGDMVFYIRETGQYVMHRIHHVHRGMLYIVGDGQTQIEGPVAPGRVFGVICEVVRKGKTLTPNNFCWWFFQKVWVRIVPLRPLAHRCYRLAKHCKPSWESLASYDK